MTVLRALMAAFALIGTVTIARPAEACPDCALGRDVRSEVWSENFGFNLVAALLPFLAVGAIGLGAEAVGQPGRGGERATDKPRPVTRVRRVSAVAPRAPRRVRST